MIEFNKDGPLGGVRDNAGQETMIIGLGTAGINVLDQMVLEGDLPHHLLGMDTDEQAVSGSVVKETHLLGHHLLRGIGSGGDPLVAEEAFMQDREVVRGLVSGTRLALVVAGLGGGTASGSLRPLLELLKEEGATVILFGLTPMTFEGTRRRLQARRALDGAGGLADAVFVLSNERLLNTPDRDLNLRSCFQLMNQLAGQSCLSLAQMLSGSQTPPAQLEQVRQMTCASRVSAEPSWENCWVALAEVEGGDRVGRAVELVMTSPLLADGDAWEKGESAIVAIVAGQEVPSGEIREVLERLQEEMPKRLPVMAATAVDPEQAEYLGVVLMVTRAMSWKTEVVEALEAAEELRELVQTDPMPVQAAVKKEPAGRAKAPAKKGEAKEEAGVDGDVGEEPVRAFVKGEELFDPEAMVEPGPRKAGRQNYFAEQEELPLNQKVDKGRFENSSPTVMNGEDLDVPTFMRMGVRVKARV